MAQDFTCSDLEPIRAHMNTMWADANFMKEIQPEVSVVVALQAMQTADLRAFDLLGKKPKVKVYWVEACEGAVDDCTSDCDFDGTEVSSNCDDFTITQCKEAIFKINDTPFYDNYVNFTDAVAKGFLKYTTLLDNEIEKTVIASLDSFAGVNKYTGDNRGDVVANDTFIKGALWNPSLMSYFSKVRETNYMPQAKIFSGENMYDSWWNASHDKVNADGAGAKSKFDTFGWFFDLINFDTILGDKKTLLVSPHAAAFVSTHRILKNETIANGANITRFTIPSMNIPGVTYDVIYRTTCENGGINLTHIWKIMANFDTYQSPVLCDNDCTGILSFTCGAAPP